MYAINPKKGTIHSCFISFLACLQLHLSHNTCMLKVNKRTHCHIQGYHKCILGIIQAYKQQNIARVSLCHNQGFISIGPRCKTTCSNTHFLVVVRVFKIRGRIFLLFYLFRNYLCCLFRVFLVFEFSRISTFLKNILAKSNSPKPYNNMETQTPRVLNSNSKQ